MGSNAHRPDFRKRKCEGVIPADYRCKSGKNALFRTKVANKAKNKAGTKPALKKQRKYRIGYTVIPSATTSFTCGTIRLSKFSIPDLSVMVEEGQPEHEPCKSTVTTPSL